MLVEKFVQLARYNQWANARLYAAALAMPDDVYRRPTGVFFGSLHGTLNHLLVTDRVWLKRLTGEGDHPDRLDAILFADRKALAKARIAEDSRLIDFVSACWDDRLDRPVRYRTMSGDPHEQKLGDVLLHVFNHQTHHRGHAHACCSIVTNKEPPSLDLLQFQRGAAAPNLQELLAA